MRTAFVDTSAWYAAAARDDPDAARVAAALREPGVRLLTSTFVFDETVTLANARLGHAAAVRLGNYLRTPEVQLLDVQPADLEEAWRLFVRPRKGKGPSFTDCTSFVLMRRLGIKTAIALDDDFRKEKFQVKP